MAVELHAAFAWDCESCGRENFERALESRLPQEVVAEAAEEMLVDENTVGWLGAENVEMDFEDEMLHAEALQQIVAVAPGRVKCEHCGECFDSELERFNPPGGEFA